MNRKQSVIVVVVTILFVFAIVVLPNVAGAFPDQSIEPHYSLGDRVWYDQDQDGIQDGNEPGYNGVTVDLYDNASCSGSPMAATTTTAGPAGFGDGYYQFTNLLAGNYCLQFGNIPAGWSISPANQGGDDALDSDANGSAQIPNINLANDDPSQDMGIYVPGSLGDSVVCSSTGDPLANITVTLFEDFDGDGVADGPAIATTETDANGFYQFSGLEVALAGDPSNTTRYIVQVDVNDADLGSCNVPVPPTAYNPLLDSNNPDDPTNDFGFENSVIHVAIDIKPGSDPNCINNDGRGVIPVAILTTADFDAAAVNPLSVALDGAGVRIKGKSGKVGVMKDVDGDGDLDLVLQIVDIAGTYQAGDTVAVLTGFTFEGMVIEGTDNICIVPPAPVALEAVDDPVTTPVETPVTIDVLANDIYSEPAVVSVQVFPQYGILGIVDVGVFQYTPNAGFLGADSFTYQICDPYSQCDTATVTIIVGP